MRERTEEPERKQMENMSAWGMGNKENERDLRMKTKAGREEKMRKDEEKGKKEKRKQQKEPSTRESSRGGDWLFQPSPGRKLIRRGWTGVSHTHTHTQSFRAIKPFCSKGRKRGEGPGKAYQFFGSSLAGWIESSRAQIYRYCKPWSASPDRRDNKLDSRKF